MLPSPPQSCEGLCSVIFCSFFFTVQSGCLRDSLELNNEEKDASVSASVVHRDNSKPLW